MYKSEAEKTELEEPEMVTKFFFVSYSKKKKSYILLQLC